MRLTHGSTKGTTPMLIVPDGWRFSSHDNFVKDETVYRLFNTALQRGFDFALQQDHLLMQTERERVEELQKWIWMITGETPPVPNLDWKMMQTPAAKAAIAKALDVPLWPKAEWTEMENIIAQKQPVTGVLDAKALDTLRRALPTPESESPTPALPPGITRHIELE